MTKLLHSRWALPCALLVALAVWIGDLRSPQGSTVTPRSRRSVEPQAPWTAVDTTPLELSKNSPLREWLVQQLAEPGPTFRDDPFVDWTEPRVLAEPAVSAPALPVLRGISVGAGQPLAILDRTVVGEGETLGPWKVDTIETDKVWITGPSGKLGLTLARDPVLLPVPKPVVAQGSNTPSTHAPSASLKPAPRK